MITKANYRLHTNAIQKHLIHEGLTKSQISFTYADEADLINVALFGMTAKEWQSKNPEAKGNMRDEASILELVVLGNLEALNAEFIRQGLGQSERLVALRKIAAYQMKALEGNISTSRLSTLLLPTKEK